MAQDQLQLGRIFSCMSTIPEPDNLNEEVEFLQVK